MTPLGLAADLAPRFAARAAAHDRDGSFPVDDFADLRDAGLMGLMVPERLGGLGASFGQYADIAMALARGNAATALVFNMHTSITGAMALTRDDLPLALGVPDEYFERRDEWLRTAAKGAFYAVAMSERGAGSRLSRLTSAYEPEGDGWRIRGTKTFCSGAGHADAYLVAARSASGEVSQFLVPAGDGLTVEPTWDSLGMRATGSHDLHLDVHVPPDALIGGVEGLGLLLAQAMPQWLVASYSAVYAGVALAAVDAGASYARERGLEKLPMVRARLGRADAQAHAAAQVVREAAHRVDADPGSPETNRWVWRAKLVAGDTAVAVASSVLEACGTAATRRGSTIERLYRDARCGALQPATSDVCADWLGLAALGLDPDRDGEVPRW
ncbi:MAG: acyl-CoA dehydrogenase [Frankiales bacterium]|nr:acyl-CoA dehydrogenase [Frankiales bacterium]